MAKKFEEIKHIEELRQRITDLTDDISKEQSLVSLMKKNPAYAGVVLVILAVFGAIMAKRAMKMILSVTSFSLKVSTLLYLVQKGIALLPKLKRDC